MFTEKDLTLYRIYELEGKNLRISIGEDVVDGERTTVVLGSDVVNGMQYVLGVYKTEEEEVGMTDEEVFKIASGADTYPVHPFWLKDDITVGSVREAVLRFARAIEDEVKSKQCVQKPKPMKEWEPSFGLQQAFGDVLTNSIRWSGNHISSDVYSWSKKEFWKALKEDVNNHLKGEDE